MPRCPWYNKEVHPNSVENTPIEGTRPTKYTRTRYSEQNAAQPTGRIRDCAAREVGDRVAAIGGFQESISSCEGCGLYQKTVASSDTKMNEYITRP